MFFTKIFEKYSDAKAYFRAYGSFGELSGNVQKNGNTIICENDSYKIESKYEKDDYGVFLRKDTFTNKSDKDINLRCLKSRFVFAGGEYEVYTQFNTWQTESRGEWQPLVTSVSAESTSFRTTTNATPFMALWNNQTNRGVAFHILPDSAWEIKVTRAKITEGRHSVVVVEMGISEYNFNLDVKPDETVQMPKIICYEFRNKLHMDCYKLHNYMHNNYPRREMPIIYDTWLYKFDNIDYETVSSQIKYAKNLGVEYFFIDAGWFGKGDVWKTSVGDWEENTRTKLKGSMKKISDEVRENGMKFGIWLEVERADPESDSVRDHGEFYMKGDVEPDCFLDFSNADAREWMLSVVDGLIEKYNIEFIKDDFNADMYFDPHNSAFFKYHQGRKIFFKELRKRHPDLYLTSCASGGFRMELNIYTEFDSFWPSDNENPYEEMRIYKDTILRLPPQGFERWVCAHSLLGFEDFYVPFGGETERIVACGDATWHNVVGVQPSFFEGYMTSGPIGFSCDLSKLSEKATNNFKSFIQKVKQNREFWKKAVARIIMDTQSATAYQYSDMELTKIEIQLFLHKVNQKMFTVIPELDANKKYELNGEILTGKQIMDEGIEIELPGWEESTGHMFRVELRETGDK